MVKMEDILTLDSVNEFSQQNNFDYSLIDKIDEQSKIKFFRFTTEANANIMMLINKYNNYIYGLLLSDHKYCFDTYKVIDIFINEIIMMTERLIHINKNLYVISCNDDKVSKDYKVNFRSLLEIIFSQTFRKIEEKFNIFVNKKELKSKILKVIKYLCDNDIRIWIQTITIPSSNGEFIEFIEDVSQFIMNISDKFYVMTATIDRNRQSDKCIIFKTNSMQDKDIEFLKSIIYEDNSNIKATCRIKLIN